MARVACYIVLPVCLFRQKIYISKIFRFIWLSLNFRWLNRTETETEHGSEQFFSLVFAHLGEMCLVLSPFPPNPFPPHQLSQKKTNENRLYFYVLQYYWQIIKR